MDDANLTLHTITSDHPAYPAALNSCVAFKTAPVLHAIGNLDLLMSRAAVPRRSKTLAIFCSRQCPGELILKIYDLAQALREAKISVISGFHTPIEQDCLKILLRGSQPIIHCPARSIHKMRLSSDQKQAIAENRLLLISPFSASDSRATAKLAEKRNRLIGAIADTCLIAYAAPNSRTLALAQDLIRTGKSVVTLDDASTLLLQEQGIAGLNVNSIVEDCLG